MLFQPDMHPRFRRPSGLENPIPGSPFLGRPHFPGDVGGGPPAHLQRGKGRGWLLPVVLLLITFLTTLLTGIGIEAAARGISIAPLTQLPRQLIQEPRILLLGLPYSLSLLVILGTHEMGHYLACLRYGIDATPPYFLPSPLLFGTFGAFIRIRAPITDRKALFDIGIAGRLAGIVVVIPVLVWGVMTSEWQPEIPDAGGLYLGDCLATRLIITHAVAPPPEVEGYVFVFGSVAMAGWVGFLATALNLLPVGQLDGGHIAYAVSERLHLWASRAALCVFVVLGIVVNESWLFWATLLILIGPRHPRLIEEERKLSPGRLLLAVIAAIVLIFSFIPDPIRYLP